MTVFEGRGGLCVVEEGGNIKKIITINKTGAIDYNLRDVCQLLSSNMTLENDARYAMGLP